MDILDGMYQKMKKCASLIKLTATFSNVKESFRTIDKRMKDFNSYSYSYSYSNIYIYIYIYIYLYIYIYIYVYINISTIYRWFAGSEFKC